MLVLLAFGLDFFSSLSGFVQCLMVLQYRNQILALWNKDVSRILPLSDCGVTDTSCADDSPRASLIKDIYAFLDLSVSL